MRIHFAPVAAVVAGAVACAPNSGLPNVSGYVNTGATLNEAAAFNPDFLKTSPNTPGAIQVTISGETLGENGLPFTPVNVGDPQFIDGWTVSFIHYIVVIGNARLSPNALEFATQNTLNPAAASRKATYVIDVHNIGSLGSNAFIGADGEEPASGLFVWNAQDNGTPFDTSTLYAFSYDTEQAVAGATNVNLTDDEFAIYDTMVANHWDKYVEGVATYVGSCDCPDPTTCDADAGTGKTIRQEFQAVDAVTPFHFKFGWDDHTSSLNCINPNNGNGDEANLANRGIQPDNNGATFAQVTLHTDHVFWDTLKQEGTPLRMDHLATWAEGMSTTSTAFDIGSLAAAPYSPVTFKDGVPIPDRGVCQNVPDMGYTMTDQPSPNAISLNVNGVPATNIKGLADFMAMSAQSQTHLNANGLCYIDGQNSADPWYVPDTGP